MRLAAAQKPSLRLLPRLPLVPMLVFGLGVLFLAGAIHVVAILLIPTYAQSDGWSRLATVAGEGRFIEIPQAPSDAQSVPGLDPSFVHGACRLNLAEAPAGMSLSARDRFWSLALYDPDGRVIFSLNDRTSIEGQLDMLVVNAVQNAELKENPSVGLEQTIVVESARDDLIALLRLYAPNERARREARTIVTEAECAPAPFVADASGSGE